MTTRRCKICHNPEIERNPLNDDGECTTCWVGRLMGPETYFLQYDDGDEFEVTKEVWVWAERDAGFWNTMGRPNEPGTGGFGSSKPGGHSVRGRIEHAPKED